MRLHDGDAPLEVADHGCLRAEAHDRLLLVRRRMVEHGIRRVFEDLDHAQGVVDLLADDEADLVQSHVALLVDRGGGVARRGGEVGAVEDRLELHGVARVLDDADVHGDLLRLVLKVARRLGVHCPLAGAGEDAVRLVREQKSAFGKGHVRKGGAAVAAQPPVSLQVEEIPRLLLGLRLEDVVAPVRAVLARELVGERDERPQEPPLVERPEQEEMAARVETGHPVQRRLQRLVALRQFNCVLLADERLGHFLHGLPLRDGTVAHRRVHVPPQQFDGAGLARGAQADLDVRAEVLLRSLELGYEIGKARHPEDGRGAVGEPVGEAHHVRRRRALCRLVVDALSRFHPREDGVLGPEARAEVDLRAGETRLGGAFLEDGERVGHPLPVRHAAAGRGSVLPGVERLAPAERAPRVVAPELEPVERTDRAELRHRLHVHAPDFGVLDARRVVLAPRTARLVAACAAPLGMVEVGLLGEVRGLHAGEVGLEAELPQNLRPFLERAEVARRVVGGKVLGKLGRHDELEDRRAVHRPVGIGIVPVHVPLPKGVLDLACVHVRGADGLRERRDRAELVDAGDRAPDRQRAGRAVRKCSRACEDGE